ncbi:hypothetical protein E2N92_09605 [Methanofollis formosanus]|uniref:Uncharacterized protein n=1 Tax=Methanofollis formosanus TaxID=299308 RepID=A0A8G1A3C1_9EURY|nr:hypothetical protein [Methanofollis formosanus]QYZ79668.1 hypothetical protein E2N92_09605 [Methanofollis formosanus]
MWPPGERGLPLLGLAVVFSIVLVALLLYPHYGGYYVAHPAEPGADSAVVHLSENDVLACPALYDLVIKGEKVLRPSPFTYSGIMWWHENLMEGWSPRLITRLEDRALLGKISPTFVEYEGSYFSVAVVRG